MTTNHRYDTTTNPMTTSTRYDTTTNTMTTNTRYDKTTLCPIRVYTEYR